MTQAMKPEEIIKDENKSYARPRLLDLRHTHYCPGCSHGVVHRIIAELLDEMGLEDKSMGVAPVGCAVFAYNYIDVDWVEAAHGRAPAVATALHRLHPDHLVFTYQGDGDMAAIGTAESIHAANRGDNLATLFINNGIYAMPGGPMAPTPRPRMQTATAAYRRRADLNGYPRRITELRAQRDGTCYVTRQAVHTPAAVRKAKAAIKKAFENALAGKGTSIVEVVSTCNSGWKMSPAKSNEWMVQHMFERYPLGDLKNV